MNRRNTRWLLLPSLALLATAAAAQDEERYSYVRKVDGAATVFTAESDSTNAAEAYVPLLTGDRLWVEPGSRLDVLLSSGAQVTLDGDSEVSLEKIALSPDLPSTETQLSLYEGRLIFAFGDYWNAREFPIVDTQNARIYLLERGSYLIEAEERGWTRVVVREGYAEVVDQLGSSVLRAGEEIEVRGDDDPRATLRTAGRETDLERWSRHQEAVFVRDSDPYLEQPLEGSADLAEYGDWVDVEGGRAWKPRVYSSWRPYWHGRWAPTPSGLYWVSYDPWRPVTYRFGTWDYHSNFGWLWYPGYAYAPAHVYWYWGPSYAAWIPSGYYYRHYRYRYPGFGFRYGVYGWAGGGFDLFGYWNFCPIRYFGSHRPHHYYRYGHELRHHGSLGRGILTTDTRGIGPGVWRDPGRVRDALERRFRDSEYGRGVADLPDVTDFVRRGDHLPEPVRETVLTREGRPGAGPTARAPRSGRGGSGSTGEPTRATSVQPLRGRDAPTRSDAATRPGRDDSGATARPLRAPRSVERGAPAAASPSRERTRETGSSPRPPAATPAEPRREAPAKRVLDGIRGRGAVSRSGSRPPAAASPRGSDRSGGSTARSGDRGSSPPPSATRPSSARPAPRAAPPPSTRPPAASRPSRPSSARPSPRATPPPSTRPPARSSGPSRAAPRRSSPPPRSSPAPSRSRSSAGRASTPSRSPRPPAASSPSRSTGSRASSPPPSRSGARSAPPTRSRASSTRPPSRRSSPSASSSRPSSRSSSSARSTPSRSRSASATRSAPSRSSSSRAAGSSGGSRSRPSATRSRSSSPRRPPPG